MTGLLLRVLALETMSIVVASRVLPYRIWRLIALRTSRVRPPTRAHGVTRERVVHAVEQASRLMPSGNNCLVRAITARGMLAHYGYQSRLIIGVTKSPAGDLESHAWLEHDGKVVIGGDVEPFIRLPDLDGKL
jgi:hypothetical protein